MTPVLITCQIILLVATLAGLWRLLKGPSIFDRILAFDLIAVCCIGHMVLLSIAWHTTMFLEVIIIFSLLAFFGTVALAFFLGGKESPEEP